MAELNKIQCLQSVKNTGFGDCVVQFKAIRGALLVNQKKVFKQADITDIIASLQTAASAASKTDRIFPIHGFEAITDNTEDPTFQSLASGRQIPIKEGNYNWVFQFYDGGLCLNNKLRSFNHTSYAVLFYDADFRLFGYKKTDTDGNDGLAGVPLDVLYTFPWKANDFSNSTQYRIQFSFRPNYINEDIAFVDAGSGLLDVKGLEDVKLYEKTANAAGVFHIGAKTGCAGTDLYDLYADDLADESLWKVTTASGASLDITSVAKDDNSQSWIVTLDTSDTDYPTASGNVNITLADTASLKAADIVGYEAGTLTATLNVV